MASSIFFCSKSASCVDGLAVHERSVRIGVCSSVHACPAAVPHPGWGFEVPSLRRSRVRSWAAGVPA
eukprot:6997761-Pyramimonas_sp.AAC.1